MGLRSFLLLMLVCSPGCGEKQDPVNDDGGIDFDVTYTQHIKRILDANCIGCHATTNQGADRKGAKLGVDFDTFNAATQSAQAANPLIQAGSMPPSGALSAQDKALFKAWVDQGLKE